LSFPSRNAIAKLAQVHGLSKKGGPSSPRSCSRSTLWHHLREIRSPKPPFGGRKSGTPKTPKPGRIGREAQEDPKAQWTPKLGGDAKTPRRIPASSKAKLSVLLRKAGFTVGRILRYLKTRGLLREEEKPRRVSATKSPRGNQRPRVMSHEKTLKTLKVASPKDLTAIDTSKVTPFLERCIGNSRKRPHLAVGLFLPPFRGHGQPRQGVPRGTPKG